MRYFIEINNVQRGPFEFKDLLANGLTNETLVWNESMPDWTPAWQVPELKVLLQAGAAATPGTAGAANASFAVPPPRPQGSTVPPPSTGTPVIASPERKTRWGCIIPVVLLVFIAGVMALTVPDKQDHKDQMKGVITSYLQNKGRTTGGILGSLIKMGSKIINENTVDDVLETLLDVKKYGVVSVGEISLGDHSTPVSVGAFGYVYTFNEKDLDKAVEKEIARLHAPVINGSIGSTIGGVIDDVIDQLDEQLNEAIQGAGRDLGKIGMDILEDILGGGKSNAPDPNQSPDPDDSDDPDDPDEE